MKARKIIIVLIFFALRAFPQQEQLTNSEKIYGLSLFWQEVNYNFAYFDQVNHLDWDDEYVKTISLVTQATSDFEYYTILQQLAAKLNDGHTEVYLPDVLNEQIIKPNISVFETDGLFYITNITPQLKKKLPVGSQILSINQKPIRAYFEEDILPNISASTDEARQVLGLEKLFYGVDKTQFALEITDKAGKINKVSLTLNARQQVGWVNDPYLSTHFENKKIGEFTYVNLPSFEFAEAVGQFEQIIDEVNKTKGLVIDLRQNVGGKAVVALNIAQYLLPQDEMVDMPWKSRQHIASLKAWGNSGLQLVGYECVEEYKDFGDLNAWVSVESDTLKLDSKRAKVEVPIVILIGTRTASAAENFLVFARQNSELVTIGEPSFGSTGQPIYFSLPGNAVARVCAKRNFDIDGSEFVGKGIQPIIYLPTTLESETKQEDIQLAKALEVLRQR